MVQDGRYGASIRTPMYSLCTHDVPTMYSLRTYGLLTMYSGAQQTLFQGPDEEIAEMMPLPQHVHSKYLLCT